MGENITYLGCPGTLPGKRDGKEVPKILYLLAMFIFQDPKWPNQIGQETGHVFRERHTSTKGTTDERAHRIPQAL